MSLSVSFCAGFFYLFLHLDLLALYVRCVLVEAAHPEISRCMPALGEAQPAQMSRRLLPLTNPADSQRPLVAIPLGGGIGDALAKAQPHQPRSPPTFFLRANTVSRLDQAPTSSSSPARIFEPTSNHSPTPPHPTSPQPSPAQPTSPQPPPHPNPRSARCHGHCVAPLNA